MKRGTHPRAKVEESQSGKNLSDHYDDAIVNFEDLRELYRKMEKEKILSSYTFPEAPSSDRYYHIYVATDKGRKQIKSKDLENLKEKVYEHEKRTHGSCRKTFKEVFQISQKERTKHVKDPGRLISIENSNTVRQQNYNRFFDGTEFENRFIDEISNEDIENLCYEVFDRIDLKEKAFKDLRYLLSLTFKLASSNYWILDNPYLRVDFSKFKDLYVRETPLHKRVHSSNDIDRMLTFIHNKEQEKPWYMPSFALELVILIGLRRGEVAPLEWSDIFEDAIYIWREQLSVKKSYDFVIVDHTKTHKDRKFPITSQLREFLDRLRAVHDEYYPDSNYLFPDPSQKNGTINNRATYRLYSRMCKKLGIPISRDFTRGPHSFRRNGITNVCNAKGGNIVMASLLYGNSPRSASMHYYTGINLNEAKEILEGNQGNQG